MFNFFKRKPKKPKFNSKCGYLLPVTKEARKELEKKGCPFCKWLKETKQK